MEDQFKARTMKRKNVKGLALSAPTKPPAPSEEDAQLPGANGNNGRADTLEIGVEFRFDLKGEDLEMIKELGSGNGGTVAKVRHTGWNVVMARKIIHVEAKKEVRKRIVRELQIMHECNSPYIVSFYGAFMNESGDVTMCMEYMDTGSLDSISKNFGPVRVDVLGKIAEAVLGGLKYLYLAHRIMHRDIKPSNVLVNSRGQIKLCDFGVSSELENSVADTFVGTGTYMAPERIQGSPYTVKSDVWSVGLTLMELAIGKFPFSVENDDDEEDASGPQGILDLLQQIVLEPPPKLPKSDAFPQILEDVVLKCLMKKPEERPTPQELYDTDPFLQAAKRTPVDLEQWAVSLMERHHRKSHLAPQLSPATRALLAGAETPSSQILQPQTQPSQNSQSSTPFDRTPITGELPFSSPSSNGSTRPFPLRTTSAQNTPEVGYGQTPSAYPRSAYPSASGFSQGAYPSTSGYPQSAHPSTLGYPQGAHPSTSGYAQAQMNLPIRQPPSASSITRSERQPKAGSERSDSYRKMPQQPPLSPRPQPQERKPGYAGYVQ